MESTVACSCDVEVGTFPYLSLAKSKFLNSGIMQPHKRKSREENYSSLPQREIVISGLDESNSLRATVMEQKASHNPNSLLRKTFIRSKTLQPGQLEDLSSDESSHADTIRSNQELQKLAHETAEFYDSVIHRGKVPVASQRSLFKRVKRTAVKSSIRTPTSATIIIEDGEADDDVVEVPPPPNLRYARRNVRKARAAAPTRARQAPAAALVKETFCDVCNDKYDSNRASLEQHQASTVHQFNMHLPVKKSYTIPPSNRGYRMLKRAGWDEEQGLGVSNQGTRDPIKTRLKPDRLGLGMPSLHPLRVTHHEDIPAHVRSQNAASQTRAQKRKEEYECRQKERSARQQIYGDGDYLTFA